MTQGRINPYIFGPPVNNPAYFFGREYELNIAFDTIAHLPSGLRQSIAVVGPRRIGKSSLLLQLTRRLESTSNITALVSTESFVTPSPLALTQEILAALREAARSKGVAAAQTTFDLLDGPTPVEEQVYQIFRRDLKRLNAALEADNQPPAVLMIDEVEGLVEFGGLRVLGLFRDLAQSLSYLLLVVAGSDRLYQLITDNTSPFFNVFKTITLTSLDDDDARAMIIDPGERAHISFEMSAVDRIVTLSGGFPYLINMLCHYATERILGRNLLCVTYQHVEVAFRHIMTHEQGYFLDLWRRAQGLEKLVLYVLAVADQPQPLSDIAHDVAKISDFRQPVAQVRDVLAQLVQRQVLRQDAAGCYAFSNQLISTWLKKNRTVTQVIDESLPPLAPGSNTDVASETKDLEEMLQVYQDNLAYITTIAGEQDASERLKGVIVDIESRIAQTQERVRELQKYGIQLDVFFSRVNRLEKLTTVFLHEYEPLLRSSTPWRGSTIKGLHGDQYRLINQLHHINEELIIFVHLLEESSNDKQDILLSNSKSHLLKLLYMYVDQLNRLRKYLSIEKVDRKLSTEIIKSLTLTQNILSVMK